MGKSTILTGPFSSSQTVKVYQAGYCGDGDLELKKGWWVFLEDILHRIQGWFHPSSSSLSCRIHWNHCLVVKILKMLKRWCFQRKWTNWLVLWNHEFYDFPYIGNVIIPSDELHHFSEGLVETTNQQGTSRNLIKWSISLQPDGVAFRVDPAAKVLRTDSRHLGLDPTEKAGGEARSRGFLCCLYNYIAGEVTHLWKITILISNFSLFLMGHFPVRYVCY